jgi:hypothetical protein
VINGAEPGRPKRTARRARRPGRAPEARRTDRVQRAYARFAIALADGAELEHALSDTVGILLSADDAAGAWALVESVARLPAAGRAAAIAHAVIRQRRGFPARAFSLLDRFSDAELAQFAPVLTVDCGFAVGTRAGRLRAAGVVAQRRLLATPTLADLAGRFLGYGEPSLAADLMAELRERGVETEDKSDTRRQQAVGLIDAWLAREPKPVPPGAVPLAVIDYQAPDQDRASGNVGDYIQTLALLGTMARLTDVEFSGEAGLGAAAVELQRRVRPELRTTGRGGRIHLLDVNRDASNLDAVPPNTWMFAFGWHMHALYGQQYQFPYHPNIRPLFLSFHVNRTDFLTAEALDYLRSHGPIGCRDWTTVDLLLNAGVDAFFTGCLTATVDALFPSRADVYAGSDEVGVIDLSPDDVGELGEHVRVITHQSNDYRRMSLAEGVRSAADLLAGYQRDLSRAVTRRLHAYLPLTALGVPVTLVPRHTGDVRFPGLAGLEPGSGDLATMQRRIRRLIETTLRDLLEGLPEAEVYARWRTRTADAVAEARKRFVAPPGAMPPPADVAGAVAALRDSAAQFGPAERSPDPTNVVLTVDHASSETATSLVESLLAGASGPVRLTVLTRGLGTEYPARFAAAFPSLATTFYACDSVKYPAPGGSAGRVRSARFDRVLLPLLLPDVSRVVCLDSEILVRGDVCELARVGLAGRPVAACDAAESETDYWRRITQDLPMRRAHRLRRWMAVEHGYGTAAVSPGVLVLDLERMRRDNFTPVYAAWARHYGLNFVDAVHAYAGHDRASLDPRWNVDPVIDDVDDAAAVNWRGWRHPAGYRGRPAFR